VVLRMLRFWCSVGLHVLMSAKDFERDLLVSKETY